MFKPFAVVVAAGALILGAANVSVTSDDADDLSGVSRVSRTIDGDTIVLEGGETVRLALVNAPELNQCGGPASKDVTADFVEDANVRLRRPPEAPQTDRYGRTVAEVKIQNSGGSVSLNEIVVLTGNGTLSARFATEDIDLAERLKKAQREARINNVGVWANCLDVPDPLDRPYESCSEARYYLDAPLFEDEVGYQEKLDANLDGVACT